MVLDLREVHPVDAGNARESQDDGRGPLETRREDPLDLVVDQVFEGDLRRPSTKASEEVLDVGSEIRLTTVLHGVLKLVQDFGLVIHGFTPWILVEKSFPG